MHLPVAGVDVGLRKPCVFQVSDLYDPKEQWASYLINAIKAKEFHMKDVNYIVRKGEARSFATREWFLD